MGKRNGIRKIGVSIKYMFSGYRMHSFLNFMRTKFLKYALVVLLVCAVGYAMLHPVDKVKVMYFLTRNCTVEIVARERIADGSWRNVGDKEKIRIDGNWIEYRHSYYQVEDGGIYRFYLDSTGRWVRELDQAIPDTKNGTQNGLSWLDKRNWERAKGKLFVWELKEDDAKVFDGLNDVRITRDGFKIAIVGEYVRGGYTFQIAMRFTRFGITNIKLPWKEQGRIFID